MSNFLNTLLLGYTSYQISKLLIFFVPLLYLLTSLFMSLFCSSGENNRDVIEFLILIIPFLSFLLLFVTYFDIQIESSRMKTVFLR